ncbi:MAG: DoxX family protein [Pseudomonadota bacterium]|nr:DoxX family protein [Pseudomonadota bacterium]
MGAPVFGGRFAPQALSLLRIVAALIFLLHGTSKLLGFPPSEMPMPPAMSFLWFGGVLELVGGLMLLFGLFSRPVAFILSGEMAVAYWMFHAPQSTFPSVNGGDAAILYCFVFLFIAAAGPGPWSVDATLGRKRTMVEDDVPQRDEIR